MRKAVVWGAPVAVLAVVALVLLSDGRLPFVPGRPPATSDPDPIGSSYGGPTVGSEVYLTRLSQLDLEGDDLGAPAGFPDSTTTPDLRRLAELTNLAAELDRDGGDVDSELDRSTPDTTEALAGVVLALIVLKAARDQDRDRRQRAEVPATAA